MPWCLLLLTTLKFAPFFFFWANSYLHIIFFLCKHYLVLQSVFAEPSSEQNLDLFYRISFFPILLLFWPTPCCLFRWKCLAASASQKIQQGTCCGPRNIIKFIILYCEKAENFSGGRITRWQNKELANLRIASRWKGAGSQWCTKRWKRKVLLVTITALLGRHSGCNPAKEIWTALQVGPHLWCCCLLGCLCPGSWDHHAGVLEENSASNATPGKAESHKWLLWKTVNIKGYFFYPLSAVASIDSPLCQIECSHFR